ncbi:hypothetical protein STEG23_014704, partial [Scotinomys teguina]
MADRRRQRASQDTEDEESGASGSDSGSPARGGGSCSGSAGGGGSGSLPSQRGGRGGGLHLRRVESGGAKSAAEESECESEDGMEGDAVLSDYESAEDSEGEEGEYSEEETSKVELKSEANDPADSSAKEKGEEKPDTKGTVTGERQSGDGQESTEPVENKVGKKGPKHLDDDEDRKNPAYIPRKGLFFEHDLRGQTQEEEVRPKGRQRKLWKDEGRWEHDKFREDEQAPKSRQELIALYGYDIRSAHNPDDIKPRRIRKPRFGSPPQRDPNWIGERSNKSHRHQGPGGTLPPRTFINRNAAGTGRMSASRNYSRSGGFKEGRTSFRPVEVGGQHGGRSGETHKHEANYRSRRLEQTPMRDPSPEPDAPLLGSPEKEEAASETPAAVPDSVPPAPDRPIEKKSYSRARRTRTKVGDAVKAAEEVPPPSEGLTSAATLPETTPAAAKNGNWEAPIDSTTGGLEQDVAQLNIAEQNWSPGQPSFLQPRELRGVPSHIHMGAGPPPQFNRIEEMGVQGGRAKRYSSQRQRPVPEPPAPPVHISIMEGHYYDPLQFQGPIYTHGDSPAPLPPQGMIVQPEMHLPHPGLHPHQSPAPLPNPGLYPPPVSMSPGQPPPQQLLAPTYFSAPGVMNFGNPSYPYAPGALPPPPPPPHLYPNTQAPSQVYGGVTYYNPAQQQGLLMAGCVHARIPEESQPPSKQVKPLFRHFRRIDSCLQTRVAFRGSDEIFCRVYMPDHSYVTIRSRLSASVQDILGSVTEKLQYSEEPAEREDALILVAVASSGEKVLLQPTEDCVFTTLGINSHLFACTRDSYEALVPLPEEIQVSPGDTEIHRVEPEDVANHLTAFHWELFRCVHELEFVDYVFHGERGRRETANLELLLQRCSEVTHWVATEVLLCEAPGKRAQLLKKFIKIAAICKQNQDLLSFYAVVMGLDNAAVSRLRLTWEKLPGKFKNLFRKFENLTDPCRNHKSYREIISKMKPPVIPFVPLILKDLTFLHEGSKTLVDGLVNIEKLHSVAEKVRTIRKYRSRPLCLDMEASPHHLQTKAYVRQFQVIDNQNLLFELSYKLEANTLLANVHCNESLVWFKASAFWYTVITGAPASHRNSSGISYPQPTPSLGDPAGIVPQDQSFYKLLQVLDGANTEQPKLSRDEQRNRGALLQDICKGTKLKKVTNINDRSAPVIEKPKGSGGGCGPGAAALQPKGGLFQGGVPKLRPVGAKDAS